MEVVYQKLEEGAWLEQVIPASGSGVMMSVVHRHVSLERVPGRSSLPEPITLKAVKKRSGRKPGTLQTAETKKKISEAIRKGHQRRAREEGVNNG